MRHALTILCVLSCLLVGCGGGKKAEPARTSTKPIVEPVPEAPPPPPTYVIAHRNAQIHLQPDEKSAFLQFRTPERQEEVDERRAEQERERAEDAKKAEEERIEREQKRRQRILKKRRRLSKKRRRELAERDRERAEERAIERAEAKLRGLRRDARKYPLRAPHRWWIPFRKIGEDGDWVAVTAVGSDAEPPHCYRDNFGGLDRLDATFYVRKSDLATLTTRSAKAAPSQGTQVIIRPGVAVRLAREATEDNPAKYDVYVDGFVLRLAIPADAVGTEYEPARPFEAPMTDTVFTARSWTRGKLKLANRMPLPYNPYTTLYVTGTLYVGARFYATTQTPCGEYTVRTHEDHIEPVGKRGVMRLTGGEQAVKPPYARAGAMSHLPSGEPFALVRRDYPLGEPTTESDGRKCYRSRVWGSNDKSATRALELCFDATRIVTVEAESK